MEFRLAKTAEEKQKAYRLRYQIYVEEMGLDISCADHYNRTISDPLDEFGYVFGAFIDDSIIGTIRTNHAQLIQPEHYPKWLEVNTIGYFNPLDTSITTRLMIDRKYRSTTLGFRLVGELYRLLINNRIKYDIIACQSTLLDLYSRFGYRIHQQSVYDPDIGELVLMVLDVEDLDKIRPKIFAALNGKNRV